MFVIFSILFLSHLFEYVAAHLLPKDGNRASSCTPCLFSSKRWWTKSRNL